MIKWTILLLFLLQMLGYKWAHCPLVGDQRTSCGIHNGMTAAVDYFWHMLGFCLPDLSVTYGNTLWFSIFLFLFFRSTLCCSLGLSLSWSRSCSHLILEGMNQAFTCKLQLSSLLKYVLKILHFDFDVSGSLCTTLQPKEMLFTFA